MKRRFCFTGKGTQNLYGISTETAARAKFLRAPACLNAAGGEEVTNEET